MAQDDKKKSVLQLISQEQYIIWLSIMVHLCKMMISLGVFFHFCKILIVWVVKGGGRSKRAKNGTKWEKICQLHPISQESYIMIFVQNHNISRRFLHFFKILIFGVVRSVKKWPIMTKNFVLCLLYLRNHISYDLDQWCTSVKG